MTEIDWMTILEYAIIFIYAMIGGSVGSNSVKNDFCSSSMEFTKSGGKYYLHVLIWPILILGKLTGKFNDHVSEQN